MAFIAGVVVVGGVIGAVAHSNYSRYSRHSDYGDAAERKRLQREAKQVELNQAKQRLQEYVNSEIQRLQSEYKLNQNIKPWNVNQATLQSFSTDYEQYHNDIKKTIKIQLENQLQNDIAQDEQAIRDIDTVILKINRIQLTNKGSKIKHE